MKNSSSRFCKPSVIIPNSEAQVKPTYSIHQDLRCNDMCMSHALAEKVFSLKKTESTLRYRIWVMLSGKGQQSPPGARLTFYTITIRAAGAAPPPPLQSESQSDLN